MQEGFSFDRIVTGREFFGREDDCAALEKAILSGENIALYSAPKEGKSSLVAQALRNLSIGGSKPLIKEIDAANSLRVKDFEDKLAAAGLGGILDPSSDCLTQIFTRLASSDDRLVISIVNFQHLAILEESDALMRALRDTFLRTRGGRLCWILSGSQLNAMKELFVRSPFFRGGVTPMTLSPIPSEDIATFIRKNLDLSGKVMEKEDVDALISTLDGNIWYIRHYMSICDSLTRGYVTPAVISDAYEGLIATQLPWFRYMVSNLSCYQLRFLQALVREGGRCNFSSVRMLERYGLNSSANVVRVRQALMKKEIITESGRGELRVIDPLFRWWLEKYFFK